MRRGSASLLAATLIGALSPLRARANAQEPAYCVSTWDFDDTEYISTSINSHDYLFWFHLGYGGLANSLLGYGTYNFGNIVSMDGRATANSVWMSVVCTRVWNIIPPYANPRSTLYEVEDTWGYAAPLVLHFTPPRDDDTADCFLPEQSVNPGRTPPTGAVRKENTNCTGSGSGGGGSTVTVLCLYYDYYDGNGDYLYSVLQGCWQQ
jgi:hypothetical protein